MIHRTRLIYLRSGFFCCKVVKHHDNKPMTGKKTRIYAVYKTFCIATSQANDKQTRKSTNDLLI